MIEWLNIMKEGKLIHELKLLDNKKYIFFDEA